MPARILIVEDNASTRFFLSERLAEEGYEITEAESCAEALAALEERSFDLVILDLVLGDGTGLELLPSIHSVDPNIPVVFLSGAATVEDAARAMRLRACDFIEKPPDFAVLRSKIAHLVENIGLRREVQRLRASHNNGSLPFIVGKSRKMARAMETVKLVAPTNANVLLTGENGTGKTCIANMIHALGLRADKPFISVNCAAIPEHLIESELFGSVKGAFTNAVNRPGLIEQADGGTLFLDEISAMKPDMQVKLLRVVEEKRVRRLGAKEEIKIDVRLISATNQDLRKAVEEGSFRQDLFYRLAVFTIDIPPLRERREDIPQIVAEYISHFNRETDKFIEGVTPEALACLQQYEWRGNVRELRNAIERAVILCDSPQIGIEHLPPEVAALSFDVVSEKETELPPIPEPPFGRTLAEIERKYISQALGRAGGNLELAASYLGISVGELRQRLSRLD